MKGKIYYRGDEGYEEARVGRVFNHRRPERYPVAVFFPEDENDVVAAVKLANTEGYKIAIRAGGHSWAAWSVRDEGILLDLKNLNKIELDLENNLALAQPAVRNTDLAPLLAQHGKMFTAGHCPTVALGGFLLQGGQGWNARGLGWAAEYIKAMDIVTADGELVRADEHQNTDLYWAARGAGPGFFGVVTRFHLRILPHPKYLVASTYLYPQEFAEPILKWLQEIHHTVATSIELVALAQSVPSLENTEGVNIPVMIVHALGFEDDYETGVKNLEIFNTCPVFDQAYVVRQNYLTSFQEQFDLQLEANPEGHRWVVNNAWLEGSPEKVSTTLKQAFTNLPNPMAFSLWYSMAPLRPLPDNMAFSMQSDIYFAAYVVWKDPEDDDLNKNWVKKTMKHLQPITAGQYLGDSDFTAHGRKFVSEANFEKIQTIRAQRDPKGLFHSYLKNADTVLNKNDFDND